MTGPRTAAIAGATVVLTNTGYYEAPLPQAGSYRVTAETPGFKRLIRSGVTLPVGVRLEIDLPLQLG